MSRDYLELSNDIYAIVTNESFADVDKYRHVILKLGQLRDIPNITRKEIALRAWPHAINNGLRKTFSILFALARGFESLTSAEFLKYFRMMSNSTLANIIPADAIETWGESWRDESRKRYGNEHELLRALNVIICEPGVSEESKVACITAKIIEHRCQETEVEVWAALIQNFGNSNSPICNAINLDLPLCFVKLMPQHSHVSGCLMVDLFLPGNHWAHHNVSCLLPRVARNPNMCLYGPTCVYISVTTENRILAGTIEAALKYVEAVSHHTAATQATAALVVTSVPTIQMRAERRSMTVAFGASTAATMSIASASSTPPIQRAFFEPKCSIN